MKKFHYCAYWHTWSRNLACNGYYYELDLTPINGFRSSQGYKIAMEVIRCHGTARRKEDLDTDVLPADVEAEIRNNVPPEIFNRLMNHDYLSEVTFNQIDNANHQSNGGGVPLEAIKEISAGTRQFWSWPN